VRRTQGVSSPVAAPARRGSGRSYAASARASPADVGRNCLPGGPGLRKQVVPDYFETFRAQAAGLRDGEGLPRFVEQAAFARRAPACQAEALAEAGVLQTTTAVVVPADIGTPGVRTRRKLARPEEA
jgi:hypothetical protein